MSIDLTAFAPRRVLEHDLLAGDRVLSRPATVLFVDLEGFTDLTGRLGEHGSRGTEQLSGLLRSFFGAVTDAVTERGGDPIGFGGDALTFLLEGYYAPEAERSADEAVHRIAAAVSGTATLAGPVSLRTRIGIAHGTVCTAVARAAGRAVPVHLGPGLDLAEEAQSRAAAGETVLGDVSEQPRDPAETGGHSDPARLTELVSPWVLDRLDTAPESHRRISAAFVRFPPLASGGSDVGEVARFLEDVRRLLATVAGSEGEVVQVSGGDKGVVALVVHGAPLAHANDPTRAAEALLRLREEVPDIAAGVATGPVFAALLGSRTRVFPSHFGLSVTTAARLMQAAGPGQVLVDPTTWDAVDGTMSARGEPRSLVLKGHEHPVETRELSGRRSTDRAAAAASYPPLVGRQSELAAIETLLDRIGDGHGGALTLVAEPGRGKSRLLHEAVERATTRGLRVARVVVEAHGRGRSQDVWRGLLAQVLEVPRDAGPGEWRRALADLPDPRPLRPLLGAAVEQEPAGTHLTDGLEAELATGALATLLTTRARVQPLLVAVDDAHALDDLSASVLAGVATATNGSPLGLLITRNRATGSPAEVPLGELSPEETAQLAADAWRLAGGGTAPGWLAPLVVERAGTNPLFVRTVTEGIHASWQPGTPPPVTEGGEDPRHVLAGLLRERVDRLPRIDQQVLAALAVLDTPSPTDTVASVLPDDVGRSEVEASVGRLVVEQLVEAVDRGRLRLRHRVLRDVIHSSLSHAARDTAHRAVVDVLVAADADPVEVAEHVRELDDPELVRRWFPAAAEAARRAWDLPRAATYLDAVRPLTSGPQRERLDVEHLEVLLVAGRTSDALALADALDEPDDPGLRVRRLLALVEAAFSSGDLARTQQAGRELMQLTDGTDELRHQRAAELVVLATAASGEGEAAVEDAEAFVVRAERSADLRAVATARAALGAALLMSGRPEEAEPHYRAALRAARDAGEVVTQVHVLSDLAGCAYERDDPDECVRLLGEARTLADGIGYRRHLVVSLTNEALLRAAVGDAYAAGCAEVAVERSLDVGDLATAASALEAWLSAEPALAADPQWWHRLVDLDRRLGRPETDHLAERAVAAARRGAVADVRAAAEEATPDEPVIARRLALAQGLVSSTDEERLAALARLESETREAEVADARELAEVAVERWRLTRSAASRDAARGPLDEAFAEEPTRLLRSWYDELGLAPPEAQAPLPPPVGIDAVLGADAAARLGRAFAAVEDAVRSRQRSEKSTDT